MPRPVLAISAALVMLAALLLVASSRADLEEDVFLRYRTTGACPRQAVFVAQVRARTNRARWVSSSAGVREFDLAVRQTAGGAVGRLVIRTPGGPPAFRSIQGRTCDDVVAALALITALAIDPKAKNQPLPSSGTPGGPPLATGTVSDAPGPAPTPTETSTPATSTPAVKPPVAPTSAPVATAPEPPEPPATPSAQALRWTVGVGPQATSGLGSELAFVLPVYVDLLWDREQIVSPSFRLAVSWLPSRVIDHGWTQTSLDVTVPAVQRSASADFMRVAGHLSGCPVRLQIIDPLALVPCLGVEAGLLYGWGDLEPTADAGALWLALTTDGRLQWAPLQWLVLELQGQFGVPLVRPRFYFEPDATILSIDPVFGTLGGGVGIRFP